ncbi:MAG: hypothetical protein OEU36_15805 [Gammaproteobacteria bacterium]|nr:hypothetical protein [Gammaproteobacteria bacterium]
MQCYQPLALHLCLHAITSARLPDMKFDVYSLAQALQQAQIGTLDALLDLGSEDVEALGKAAYTIYKRYFGDSLRPAA